MNQWEQSLLLGRTELKLTTIEYNGVDVCRNNLSLLAFGLMEPMNQSNQN